MIEQIENNKGGIDFLITCDGRGCKTSLDAKDMLFAEAVGLAKCKGWRIYKLYGTWQHFCCDCRLKFNKEKTHESL